MTSHRRTKRQREGAVLLVVMMVLLMSSASAIFAIHATAFEIRASGHVRQAMQTRNVAESGLVATLALVDYLGPQALLHAMDNSTPPTMYYEPALAQGKTGYRVYLEDFDSYFGDAGAPVDANSLGQINAYDPRFIVDINDHYTYTAVMPGHRADGYGRLQYLFATYTARGRSQVRDGDLVVGDEDSRFYNEGASDARAYCISGPFGR